MPLLSPCRPLRADLTKRAGSSLIEFSVIAIPVLLVGLGGVELAQWFYVKQAVSLALLQGARAGITDHANPNAIQAAFERGLSHLYPATPEHSAEQRMQAQFKKRSAKIALPPWQIEVIGPSAQAFQDFTDTQRPITRQTGLAAINNSYQAEQDASYRARGWVNGLGPNSGQSIYQANTLILRVTYLHEPLLPGVKGLLRMLSTRTNTYSSQAMALGGYLPITQKLALTMQSDPLNWPALKNRKVVKAGATAATPAPYPDPDCHGLWCLKASSTADQNVRGIETDTPHVDAGESQAGINVPASEVPPGDSPNAGWWPDLAVTPDDPACGVTLCCIGA